MRRSCLLLCALIAGAAPPSHAGETPTTAPSTLRAPDATPGSRSGSESASDRPPISRGRRAAAIATAIVPGLVVHGAGTWLTGERRAPRRLLRAELAGVALMLAGGIPLVATYGSRRVAPLAVPVAAAGTGIFLTSWLADVWTAAGGPDIAGAPRAAARWQLGAGLTWVADPLADASLYPRVDAVWHAGRFDLAPSLLIAADGDAQRGTLDAGWRLRGAPATGAVVRDGSYLEGRAAAIADREGADGFTLATALAYARGRLDLSAVDPAMAGGFADGDLGVGLELADYEGHAVDVIDLVIARVGFGVYLGDGRGELQLFYDHRRDDLAGGLAASRAAGFLGSVGGRADVVVRGPWAIAAELQVGSAWITTLAVRFRAGATP